MQICLICKKEKDTEKDYYKVGRNLTPRNICKPCFNKKSNDANWTYLTSTRVDEVPYCSEFKTDVLKKAFKDVDCYDDQSQKESTVQQRA